MGDSIHFGEKHVKGVTGNDLAEWKHLKQKATRGQGRNVS